MSKVKGQGSSKNNHKTAGKRLGIKLADGQQAFTGQIIVRQVGLNKRAGAGTYVSRNFTIHAAKDGIVHYKKKRFMRFNKRTSPRTVVSVE